MSNAELDTAERDTELEIPIVPPAQPSRWTSALKLIRNAAAHNHIQNFNDVQMLRSAYVVFPIGHPTHAMFWIDPHSSDFLITHAMQELKEAGFAAIT